MERREGRGNPGAPAFSFRVLLPLLAAVFLLQGCGAPAAGTPESPAAGTSESSAAGTPESSAAGGADMTLLIYMIGSDLESLNGCASADISEMIAASPGKNVRVFLETGGAAGWKNYGISAGAIQRYEVSGSGIRLIEEKENARMSDADTLSDFLAWGRAYCPAERTGVILWNHGGGSALGYGHDELFPEGMLSLTGLQEAFRTAGGRYAFVGFDACLMSTVETCRVLSGCADYLIASEETEPGDGWYYTGWLKALEDHPGLPMEELGQRITGDFAAQREHHPHDSYTLAMIRLDRVPAFLEKLEAFFADSAGRIREGEYGTFAAARVASKSFGGGRYEQIDVRDYLQRVDPEDASGLSAALSDCVVCFETTLENTCGLAMYYPWELLQHYSKMMHILSGIGCPDSYLEFYSCFCSVLSIAGNESPAETRRELLQADKVPVSKYSGRPWYREDVVKLYYPEACLSANEAVLTRDAEEFYDCFYWIDLPKGIEWENIWYREDRVLLDDGTRLLNIGTDAHQDLYQEESAFIVYDPVWYCIGNTVVPCFFRYFEERTDGIRNAVHHIPAVLNGTDNIQIIVHENRVTREITVPGYYKAEAPAEYDGIPVPDKACLRFHAGDELRFPMDCYDYEYRYLGTELSEGKEIVGEGGPEVVLGYTGNRSSRISASFRDIYNNYICTPWVTHRRKEAAELPALTEGAAGEVPPWVPDYVPGNMPETVGLPYGSAVSFGFRISNQSPREIREIFLKRAEYPDGAYQDILYETLPPGKCALFADSWHYSEWDGSVWMLDVRDAEGRQCARPAAFNPWAAKELIISWDAGKNAYEIKAEYGEEDSPEQEIETFLSRLPEWNFSVENTGDDVITHMYMGVCEEKIPEKMKEASRAFTMDDLGGNDMIIELIPPRSSIQYSYPVFNEGNHPVWALAVGDPGLSFRDAEPVLPFPLWYICFEDLSGRKSAETVFSPWETEKIVIRKNSEPEGPDYVCEFTPAAASP